MIMPAVLHFILCDRVRVDPANLHRIDIEGLRTSIRSKCDPRFPCCVPMLTALAILMGGEGEGEIYVQVVDDAGTQIYASPRPHPIKLVGPVTDVKGAKLVATNCTFPHPGLYWVQLTLFGQIIARQPIRVHL
jgi:hypothetical protein